MMIHDFDMARFLLGEEPVEVFALGSSLVDPAIGKAGDVDTAAVHAANRQRQDLPDLQLAPRHLWLRPAHRGAWLERPAAAGNVHETTVSFAGAQRLRPPIRSQNFFLERYASAYRNEVEAFIDAVVDGKKPSPSGHDGLQAQMLADAATKSRKPASR